MAEARVGLGLVGAGAFGRYCMRCYRELPGVEVVAAADADPRAAQSAARDLQAHACESVDGLLSRPDVDMVHIATPPATHHELVMKAVAAGKHVLCEKPLAITTSHAEAMIDAARSRGRVLAVNLIMRYNPLCQAVEQILRQGLLGRPLRAYFENYAKDEPLGPGHWFWDPAVSGGIFIEHGVHFFDLFAMWFGEGRVVAAQQMARPEEGIIDQVRCTAVYGPGVLADFYHGFHQASRMDRQQMRIVCERGDIRLDEWVPTSIRVEAIMSEDAAAGLERIVPDARLETVRRYSGDERAVRSRGGAYEVDARYTCDGGVGMTKDRTYGLVLRELLADQLAAVADPSHARRVTEANGLGSLRMACDATRLAQQTGRGDA